MLTPPSNDAAAPPPTSGPPNDSASKGELICYSLSGVCETISAFITTGLAMPILNIGLGVSPAIISTILSVRGIYEAFIDPAFGNYSDNFRSRWGRRRPFILIGGILVAICSAAVWLFPFSWSRDAIATWFGVGVFLLATCTTIFSVSYNALGIEMGPSYEERTRVVAYKSLISCLGTLALTWAYPFCLLPVFSSEVHGVRVLTLMAGVLCVAAVIVAFRVTRERTRVSINAPKEKFLPAVKRIGSNPNFLRVTGVSVIMLSMLSLFGIFDMYVNIYYVFGGNKAEGANLGAIVNSTGTIVAMLSIPAVTWLCNRIQKHNTLMLALALMVIGCILKWFVARPEHPYYQMILPFCFGIGISSVFVVLGAMQGDLVDEDELISGQRREGLFSCVASWMMKSAGSVAGAISGLLLVAIGFNSTEGAHQPEHTIFWIRFFNSFAPAFMISLCFLLLYKYPLTAARMHEIRAIIDSRKAAEGGAETSSPSLEAEGIDADLPR